MTGQRHARAIVAIGLGAMVFEACSIAPRHEPSPAPAELNHVYVTLHKETIEAIATSAFLAETFAMLDQATTTTAESVWTGTYLFGWRGYLELFSPGGAEGLVEGSSGIGLSTVRLGDGKAFARRLDALAAGETRSDLMTRVVGQQTVPWFDCLRLRALDRGPFAVWLMDFRPEYIEGRGMPRAADGRFDRHGYNAAEYSDPARMRAYQSRLFDDLTEVHLDLTPEESASLGSFLQALGYAREEVPSGTSYRAGDFTFLVSVVPGAACRIRSVRCSLRSVVEPAVEHVFGRDARLLVSGRTAVWSFGYREGPTRRAAAQPPRAASAIEPHTPPTAAPRR